VVVETLLLSGVNARLGNNREGRVRFPGFFVVESNSEVCAFVLVELVLRASMGNGGAFTEG
jgi:hypothetical protein